MAQNDKMNMLNTELADQMLSNIFDICEVEHNTVPLEELESYSNYRKDKYIVRRVLLVIIMFLFLLIPLLFMSPSIMSLKQANDADPTYNLNVESLLPLTSVSATIDGQNVPVYDKGNGLYTIEPSKTGEMLVTVKCVNNQYVQKKVKVTNVDTEPPAVVTSNEKDGKIYIYLEDNITGVDYDKIYAMSAAGNTVLPVSCNVESNLVVFNYPKSSLNIFIPDKAGNTLQLLLTV